MNITLRKALKVRKTLEAHLAKPDVKTDVEISIFTGVDSDVNSAITQAVSDARRKAETKRAEHAKLSSILAALRVAIAKGNVAHKVEEQLAAQAHIERQIAALKPLAEASETPPIAQVAGEIVLAHKALNAEDALSRYRTPSKTVTVSFVDAETKAKAQREIAALKREKEAQEDARMAGNGSGQVEIADDDFRFLTEKGIV